MVSTSGSSGMSGDRLEHDRAQRRSVLAQLVGGEDLCTGLLRRLGTARVDLGEDVAFGDGVPALPQAAHADGMVDALLLRLPPGAEPERCQTDVDRTDRADVAGPFRD